MILKSTSFRHYGPIPRRYSGEGSDISPELEWSDIPEGTKGFALICEDPDAPIRPEKDHPFVHWVVYNIPGNLTYLPEGIVQAESVELPVFIDQGKNSFGKFGYGGPMPPVGHGPHHYHFIVYALNAAIGIPSGLTKAKLMRFIKPHVLASAQCVGTYERVSAQSILTSRQLASSEPLTKH